MWCGSDKKLSAPGLTSIPKKGRLWGRNWIYPHHRSFLATEPFRVKIMTQQQSLSEPATGQGETIVTDVAIVGGGLAGSLAAAVLTRSGYRVLLIDKRAVYPEEFRVEKISGQQVDSFRRLGFLDALSAQACSYESVLNIRDGKVVDVSKGLSFGIHYARLVAMARGLVSDPSSFMVDQVLQVECSDDLQHLTLASGNRVTSRLVVLATGMSPALTHNIGITRRSPGGPPFSHFRLHHRQAGWRRIPVSVADLLWRPQRGRSRLSQHFSHFRRNARQPFHVQKSRRSCHA